MMMINRQTGSHRNIANPPSTNLTISHNEKSFKWWGVGT